MAVSGGTYSREVGPLVKLPGLEWGRGSDIRRLGRVLRKRKLSRGKPRGSGFRGNLAGKGSRGEFKDIGSDKEGGEGDPGAEVEEGS